MNTACRLLIFDWDGTLMDSGARITDSVKAAIEQIGAQSRTTNEIRNIIGLGLNESIKALYPGSGNEFCEQLAQAYRDCYAASDAEDSRLFDGVINVLDQLKQAGYLLAIATGKSRAGLDIALQEVGIVDYLDASRCADESRSKPHPQMLHELLNILKIRPNDALMIGDTEYDMEMATRADVSAIAVSYGVHEIARLQQYSPLAILDDIRNLPEALEKF